MSTALAEYAVAWYGAPTGAENALERFKPGATYEADGDLRKKSVTQLMGMIKRNMSGRSAIR